MNMAMTPEIKATYIGCGCDDTRACEVDCDGNGCHWLRVDYRAGLGVCSECPEHEARWDSGDRTLNFDDSISDFEDPWLITLPELDDYEVALDF